MDGSCLYLGLGTSVVFLLGHVLPALRLGSRYVVGNGHWRASKRVTAGVSPQQQMLQAIKPPSEETGERLTAFLAKRKKKRNQTFSVPGGGTFVLVFVRAFATVATAATSVAAWRLWWLGLS